LPACLWTAQKKGTISEEPEQSTAANALTLADSSFGSKTSCALLVPGPEYLNVHCEWYVGPGNKTPG